MEASSHGLKQNRLDGLLFNIGIFTNISHDHLDYHKNFNDYLNSKLYLFKKLLKKNGDIITDQNIPEFRKIEKISKLNKLNLNVISSNKENSGMRVTSHRFNGESQIVYVNYKRLNFKFRINLIGKIQIKNILMALIAAEKSGVKILTAIKNLSNLKPISGRLEKVGEIKITQK